MTIVTLDFETRSEADLKKVGQWAYSEHPSTEIICACWKVDDQPFEGWFNPDIRDLGAVYALDHLFGLIENPEIIFEAHNLAFEYAMWKNVAEKRMGWPEFPEIERLRDTMATAAYYSMPPGLDNLCRVLGLPGKDPEGSRLITKYSKLHLKTAKREIPEEDCIKWLRYCGGDCDQEAAAGELLGDLPEDELAVFHHDFWVNVNGIHLDPKGIQHAMNIVEQRQEALAEEFYELTDLEPTQVTQIRQWVVDHGLDMPNLRADTIDDLLDEGRLDGEPAPPVSKEIRKVLTLRRKYARASTKKLDAMMRQRGKNGRAYFQTRYHGAGTGRNTGSGFQPLNLVRSYDPDDFPPEQLVRDIAYENPRYLDMLYGDAMDAVAKSSRYWIDTEPGHRILAADFSSIEAVVNACLAGEEWKIQLFRDKGDPYVAFASQALNRKVLGKKDPGVTTQDKEDRQKVGKPGELAFGYQGAVNAWRKFDTSDTWEDEDIVGFVKSWRALHPRIKAQWYGLEDAAVEAVDHPGRVTGYRNIGFERVDGWLTMILPDGKRLWYWAPQIRMVWPQWHQPSEKEDCATGECGCKKRPQVTYQAQKEGRWRRVSTYGGKLTENAVQATSRQILKPIELRVAAAGYKVVLSVYDEIVTEMPEDRGSLAELQELMEEPAGDWCADWPIRADPWEGLRYRK